MNKFSTLVWGTISAFALGAFILPATANESPLLSASAKVIPAQQTTRPGCGKQAIHKGVFDLYTTDKNNTRRTYLVQIPESYESWRAYSIIFVFHAAGGSSSQSYSWGLQNVDTYNHPAAENAIFVFPNGVNFQNYGIGWDDSMNGYDMSFFDNMLKSMENDFCVDPARVFVAGFSWGGDFVAALTCARGYEIRGAAVNSATDEYSNAYNYATYNFLPCPSSRHPPMRFEHAAGGDGAYPWPRFVTTTSLFQHLNSCSAATTQVPSGYNLMSCKSFNNCANEFIDCSFNPGLGHTLPVNWARDTWTFFASIY